MITIESSGNELAKVLWYYNLINDFVSIQKVVCPFHEDVNPSMLIDLDKGSWFCFGCNLSGDAFSFVKIFEKKYNNLNDLQAYKKYIKILKSKKSSKINYVPKIKSKKLIKEADKEAYVIAYDYYHGLKKVNWQKELQEEEKEAYEYMKNRGFTSYALNKCKAKVTYNKNYSIIFPMLDNGKFKGWVCRTFQKEIEKKRKYLYNKGFSRATTLVGNYGKEKYVFVVEGYMDRLKFVQFGIDNVVAILGWKMSAQQIQKLKDNGITTVISALDNDACGKKGTKFLKQHFKVVRFCYLKRIKDPGEMTQELFNKMLNKTMKKFKEEE